VTTKRGLAVKAGDLRTWAFEACVDNLEATVASTEVTVVGVNALLLTAAIVRDAFIDSAHCRCNYHVRIT